MPKMSDIIMLDSGKRYVLSIRKQTQIEKLPALIGESFCRIGDYLKTLGENFSEMPFVAYHNLDMQNPDAEMGFPVRKPLPGKGDIKSKIIPAGKSIICMYRGAYSKMPEIYDEMAKWIADKGYKMKGTAYEYYYNGPGYPEEELLTKIEIPIK